METSRRTRHLATGLLAVGMFALVGAGPGLAKKPAPKEETSGSCPATSAAAIEDPKVAVSFSSTGLTTTYKFISLEDQNPASGVPGLVKYCVYPSPSDLAKSAHVSALAKGGDGSAWLAATTKRNVGFVRPGGNETNIPLEKQTVTMGTVTWTELPTEPQVIRLHIADESVCGAGVPTCFVVPTGKPGPDCGAGPTNVAYSAIPFEVLTRCPPRYALGFEATSTKEAGDAVKLAGEGKYIRSLNVAFASFACSKSGVWYEAGCVTEPSGTSYKHPIFARLYEVKEETPGVEEVGTELGKVEVDATIPYRPSAEGTAGHECGAKYWDAAAERCKSGINFLVTFDFGEKAIAVPVGRKVIWTVSVNTTNTGYDPIEAACEAPVFENGCPYDALNLDTWSYAGEFGKVIVPGEGPGVSPYSGLDLNAKAWWTAGTSTGLTPKPEADGQLGDGSGGEAHLGELRPVGEILTE